MNSHNISQFENHVRAVCGLEKIETKKLYNAKMINLIGDEISPYRNKIFKDNEFFYDYLKTEIKQKRKMGHLTIIEK
jgi:5-(carboxyamino)imidazole ribonucleotide synthase